MVNVLSGTRRSWRALAGAGVALALAAATTSGCTEPPDPTPVPVAPGFVVTKMIGGLQQPTVVRQAPDGRLFVAEKAGRVKVFDGPGDDQPDLLADLSPAVHDFWDHGMLGLAVDPAFPTRPYVYVFYAWDAANRWHDACPDPPGAGTDGCVTDGRVSRLTVGPGNTLAAPETVLIQNRWCAQFASHGVGTLTFGRDGALYVSAGDGANFENVDFGQYGGSPGSPVPANPCGDPGGPVGARLTPPNAEGGALRSQDMLTGSDPLGYGGTVLRIDPDTGRAHPGNPLAGSPLAVAAGSDRIIAHGLRNPFRVAARPGTDELWVADVGWLTHEEIDRIPDPDDAVIENFGWPCFEGPTRQPGYESAGLATCQSLYRGDAAASRLTGPHFSYRHDALPDPARCGSGGGSVTGMAFYSGTWYPGAYHGALFFSDYSHQCLWAMLPGPDGVPDPGNVVTIATKAPVVHLEPGPAGDLMMVDLLGGTIYRLGYFSANKPPVAAFAATPPAGALPLAVTFDAARSTDPEAGALRYEWDLDGDGAFDDGTGAQVSRTYTTAGRFAAGLRVTDPEGATATATVELQPGNQIPTAAITGPDPAARWAVGDTIAFTGTGSDPDGALPDSAFSWQLTIHHCASPTDCHQHPLQRFTGRTGSFAAPDHEYPSHLTLDLTVTDPGGLKATRSVRLDPRTVPLTVTSDPPGLQVALGATNVTTPFTREVIVGSANSVTAPSPQAVPSGTYAFTSWADGGPATRTITAPAAATTYTARYTRTGASPPDGVSYLSDLPWLNATNGWGPPERNRSNGDLGEADGRRLSVAGVGYDKGVGMHAPATLTVALNRRCTAFDAVVGIDDEVGNEGLVSFIVFADSVVVARADRVGGADPTVRLHASVAGAQNLDIWIANEGDSGWDHADLADARLTCG